VKTVSARAFRTCIMKFQRSIAMQKKDFSSLGLSNWLVSQITAVGYKNPTPVQENCIQPILEGRAFFFTVAIYCHN